MLGPLFFLLILSFTKVSMNPRALGERAAVGREADHTAEADLLSTFGADAFCTAGSRRQRPVSWGAGFQRKQLPHD